MGKAHGRQKIGDRVFGYLKDHLAEERFVCNVARWVSLGINSVLRVENLDPASFPHQRHKRIEVLSTLNGLNGDAKALKSFYDVGSSHICGVEGEFTSGVAL